MDGVIIRKAIPEEFHLVQEFYYKLIDDMQEMEYHPMWEKGVYPDDDYLHSALANGELYVCLENVCIIGAMIVNHKATDGYDQAQWPTQALPSEVTIIHALGVSPSFARRGIAKTMVREVIRKATESGGKAIRLDVLEGNIPAERLYQSLGFHFIKKLLLYYVDTGWHNFDLYEYPL